MTDFRIASETDRRARLMQRVAMAVVLVIGAITAVNSIKLSRLADQAQADPYAAQFNALSARVAALERQVDGMARQPVGVKQVDFELDRQALEARLTAIERAREGVAQAADVQVLQARLDRAEAQLVKAQQRSRLTATTRRRVATTEAPATPVPPFRVIGLQQRAGTRFLSILPQGAAALAHARLLHEGDHEGAWHLQSIGANAAVFRVAGQILRVAMP
ncbi:hypothetical protein [Chitinimonas koreensis]|uniref:hypothetical protein n=1 Tax=Chitinimonas koreensis TaxID=356302 RepID=UPI000405B8E0|nr:hypothetical protein [Chitinimonas koreensis]QNM96724.1 hypothetical protein H9L41_23755 [Chitinimonas koreensis]